MPYQENKPYVVSADCQGLFMPWAKRNQVSLPKQDYFQGMLRDLETTLNQYFAEVNVVPEDLLRSGLNELIRKSLTPVISLDRAYVNPKQKNLSGFLDITRTVDGSLENTGLGSRALEITMEKQISKLVDQQKGKEIALIDDVIFEGKTLLNLVNDLRDRGVLIKNIYAGITIKEGRELLEANELSVSSVLSYEQVADEICERDFVAGAPLSGRSVANGNGVVEGAPYFYPFGKPSEWASIPVENAVGFSEFCLYQSLQFWLKTEQLSSRDISTKELDKPIFGLPENTSISAAILGVMSGIKEAR